MKNVTIFQDFIREKTYGHEWKKEELFRYFRAQVDNSLHFGWEPEDIIICTNLDFQYNDVTIIKLSDICQYNKYFNKQYGIAELLRRELVTEDFWFHDFDDWQLSEFSFPDFDGDIGLCKYINFTQWNTGSIFIKPDSVDIWELMVELMKLNEDNLKQIGDENIFNFVYQYYPEIQHRFSLIDQRYNVGITGFVDRYCRATLPVMVGGFKPSNAKDIDKFREYDLIPEHLEQIFKAHNLI